MEFWKNGAGDHILFVGCCILRNWWMWYLRTYFLAQVMAFLRNRSTFEKMALAVVRINYLRSIVEKVSLGGMRAYFRAKVVGKMALGSLNYFRARVV